MIGYSGYDNIRDVVRSRKLCWSSYRWTDILKLRMGYKGSELWNFYLRDDLRKSQLFKELTQ